MVLAEPLAMTATMLTRAAGPAKLAVIIAKHAVLPLFAQAATPPAHTQFFIIRPVLHLALMVTTNQLTAVFLVIVPVLPAQEVLLIA